MVEEYTKKDEGSNGIFIHELTDHEEMAEVVRESCRHGWELRIPSGNTIIPIDIVYSTAEKDCFIAQAHDQISVLFSPAQISLVTSLIGDQEFNYLWIRLFPLFVTPNVRNYSPWPVVEKLTEVAPGIYLRPNFWEDKVLPDGRPMPSSARLVFRCLGGNIVMSKPGSPVLSMPPDFYFEDLAFFRMKTEQDVFPPCSAR